MKGNAIERFQSNRGTCASNSIDRGPLGTAVAWLMYVVMATFTAPIIFVLAVPFMLYRAWALTILWGWFVVPVFNLPPLSLGHACGLILILFFLTSFDGLNRDRYEAKPRHDACGGRPRAAVRFGGRVAHQEIHVLRGHMDIGRRHVAHRRLQQAPNNHRYLKDPLIFQGLKQLKKQKG
jgi:hypothetical protein